METSGILSTPSRKLLQTQADARHINERKGVEAGQIIGHGLAQGQVGRAIKAGELGVGRLQCLHCDRQVAGQLQLLPGQNDGLFDLDQGQLFTAARDVLIQRLQGRRLGLEFGDFAIGGAEPGLQCFNLLA